MIKTVRFYSKIDEEGLYLPINNIYDHFIRPLIEANTHIIQTQINCAETDSVEITFKGRRKNLEPFLQRIYSQKYFLKYVIFYEERKGWI